MERKNIIQKLVKEGLSEKTLANFSDKQIELLANRMLGEQVTTMQSKPSLKVGPKGGSVPPSPKGYSVRKDPSDPNSTILQPQESELKEKLIGKQKNLDKNQNGKLDSDDFKMIRNQDNESYDIEEEDMSNDSPYKSTAKYQFLSDLQTDPDFIKFKENRFYDGEIKNMSFGTPNPVSNDNYASNKRFSQIGKEEFNDDFLDDEDNTLFESKKKPSAGLSKEKKSAVVKKAKAGKDVGKKGKTFKDIEAKAKASGAKEPKAVAAAAMWKNIKRESKNENTEVKEWLNNIVETEYHPFTSKNEILSLIKSKLNK